MRPLLPGLGALLVSMTVAVSPAAALDPPARLVATGSAAGVTIHQGLPPGYGGSLRRDGPRHDGNRGRDGRGRRNGDSVFIYDRDYQGDTAWRAQSYNDWWHERPNRSYPRWMANNQDCQRMWWSGGGWRC